MRVGVVGAGFVGLATAYRLARRGIDVSVYEASGEVGGLASGFRLPGWEWPVERFYHHIFTNDASIIALAREVGWPPVFYRPTTSVYLSGEISRFDSALSLLQFPHLSWLDKIRMGLVLAFLKGLPFWRLLERYRAVPFLASALGEKGYKTLWEPLLRAKFGPYASSVSASWFWARIHKRTPSLGYFRAGFQGLANQVKERIVAHGGQILLHSPVTKIVPRKTELMVRTPGREAAFERVIVTLPTPLYLEMVPGLSPSYRKKLLGLRFLDALVVLLVVRERVLPGVYWLNVAERRFPFLVVVEHTNMVPSLHYGGQHLVYLGAYLPPDHQLFGRSQRAILSKASSQLREISGSFSPASVVRGFVWRGRGAQPVVPVGYAASMPSLETPLPGLFLANMSLVYPWDRGTNYAVELGEKVASLILREN